MPEGHVTGFDLSEVFLDKARQTAVEQNCTNADFVQGDVYNLPFEDDTFNVVHTHQAVCHFHEQVKAIKELLRVIKPGGVLCMREADSDTVRFWPPQPLLDECFEMIRAVQRANGGSPDAGIKLKHCTVEAGVPRDKIEFTAGDFVYHTREQTEAFGMTWPGRVTQGALADKAVEMGFATRERLEE
ncbi:hypothetical protein LTR78_008555 [Recurvomyces mirabilis]|uniref:Methyltransferase domain-containing protein n=1 Tax=Recurvomyces mirabilis TaxID=574656 RepID=A0AAE0TQ15_9PEZI|nr:hypothetical protein LTR78_008555 [Recurvomyces mirabilis]KAK5156306.1 hypothetical protein LTS14_005194 [Recurvomyces mirabilis]